MCPVTSRRALYSKSKERIQINSELSQETIKACLKTTAYSTMIIKTYGMSASPDMCWIGESVNEQESTEYHDCENY